MGLFVVRLPAIGYYDEVRAFVFKRDIRDLPHVRNSIYSIKINHQDSALGNAEYARIRLLSHAQMAQKQFSEYRIRALFYPWFPHENLGAMHLANKKALEYINEFVDVLQDPKTNIHV